MPGDGRHRQVCRAILEEHYDLLFYLQRNWPTVGPKLDSFFLERAVRELEAWMKTTESPHYEGFFMYGDQKPHCWNGPGTSADRLRDMAEHGLRKMPTGTTAPWWKY